MFGGLVRSQYVIVLTQEEYNCSYYGKLLHKCRLQASYDVGTLDCYKNALTRCDEYRQQYYRMLVKELNRKARMRPEKKNATKHKKLAPSRDCC